MTKIIIAALATTLTLSTLSGCLFRVSSRHHDYSSNKRHSGNSTHSKSSHEATDPKASPAPRPATINHIVFFKLNHPEMAGDLIADCDENLASIPGVASYFCGQHIDTGRDTVDDNYDVGVYIGFNSEEDYQSYLEHPDHVALVEEWLPTLEWIQVRDVYDDSP